MAGKVAESMMDLDPEGAIGEDEIDDDAHTKLLSSIYALGGRKRSRNEVRGAGLSSSNLDLLVHTKKDSSKIAAKELNIKASSMVAKPLSSVDTEKAKRQIARDVMETDTKKWEPIVKEIRAAPQIKYAERPVGIEMYKAMKPAKFTPRTPLEKELYEALGKSADVLTADMPLTKAEEEALKAMSVEEAAARRTELLKHQALLSRMQVKAQRIKKIKSKRYRRVLKKEREAKKKKELEAMEQNDPEAFLERMKDVDRARMEERLTLKHKVGGKFARYHKAFSKFDSAARDAIQEMVQKGKDLTRKQIVESSSDEEDIPAQPISKVPDNEEEEENEETGAPKRSDLNSRNLEMLKTLHKKAGGWLSGSTKYVLQNNTTDTSHHDSQELTSEVVPEDSDNSDHEDIENVVEESDQITPSATESEHVTGNRKSQKRKRGDNSESAHSDRDAEEINVGETVFNTESSPQKTSAKKRKTSQNNGDEETHSESPIGEDQINESNKRSTQKKKREKKSDADAVMNDDNNSTEINEEKTEEVKQNKAAETVLLKPSEHSGENVEGDEEMAVTLEELFEDEDVVEQFARDKEEEEEKRRPKEEDKTLPGWGHWDGPSYKEHREKREEKKKTIKKKFEKPKPRTDKKPHLWLNPKRDENIRKFQPKTVPFPFASADQYEAAIRQPISRGFVREMAHKILIKPEVVTKQGHIIKPLDKEDFFNNKGSRIDDEEDVDTGIKYTGPIDFRNQDNRLKTAREKPKSRWSRNRE